MRCVMTPMPNHLSTQKPHHNRVEKKKRECGKHTTTGVWRKRKKEEKKECGDGEDEVEQNK